MGGGLNGRHDLLVSLLKEERSSIDPDTPISEDLRERLNSYVIDRVREI